jgi:hypothetical protein
MEKKHAVSSPQLTYAGIQHWIALIGQIILALAFVLYVLNILPQKAPIDDIANFWHLSAEEFNEKLDIPTGWSWVSYLGHSDIISYATIIFLALGTFFCLTGAAVSFIREKNVTYTIIVILQILVLLTAASGITIWIVH